VVSKALETNRISLNEINSCSSSFFKENSARRIAAIIAKLPEYCKGQKAKESTFDPILF